MKIRVLQNSIAAVIFGFALLFGIIVGSSTTTYGQLRGRNWDGYPNWGGSFDLRQTALNAGYNEGIKDGRKDREKGRHTDYRNQSSYQKATKDYSSRLGDLELYRRYFREAYKNGYYAEGDPRDRPLDDRDRDRIGDRDRNMDRDRIGDRDRNDNGGHRLRNWDRYGNYGGSSDLRQTALNAGYNEGIKEGRNDRKRNRRSDIQRFGAYQNATHDYSSRLGNLELYRRYYREGFENGYDDGLNGY